MNSPASSTQRCKLTHTRVKLCAVIIRWTTRPLLPPSPLPLFTIMPKVKTKRAQDTVADAACGVVMSGMVGRSGGGNRQRSQVLRTMGTRSHPLPGIPLTGSMLGPSDETGVSAGVSDRVSPGPEPLAGNLFSPLRVSIPDSENTDGLVGVSD